MIYSDNKLLITRSIGFQRIIKPVINDDNFLIKIKKERIMPTIIKKSDIIHIKIISAKNRYFWYFLELQKPFTKRRIFQAFKTDKGIVTNEGFVYNGSFKIVKNNKKKVITLQNSGEFIIEK